MATSPNSIALDAGLVVGLGLTGCSSLSIEDGLGRPATTTVEVAGSVQTPTTSGAGEPEEDLVAEPESGSGAGGDTSSTTEAPVESVTGQDEALPHTGASEASLLAVVGLSMLVLGRLALDGRRALQLRRARRWSAPIPR